MHRSVTAPYPSGYVLAAGRLRPRRKPERKLFYTERVTYFARKVKHKKAGKVPVLLDILLSQFYGKRSQFYSLFVIFIVIFTTLFQHAHGDEPAHTENRSA